MSPRPRTISDDEILAGTARVITRLGPARLTLAEVAAEVGLAPATLLQRFKTKRGLLLALAERSVETLSDVFRAARQAERPPLETLLAALTGLTRHVSAPEAMANHLAFLQLDLTDPELHRQASEHARGFRDEIRSLLDAAVQAGELVACDTERLARAVQIAYNGSLLLWAIERQGELASWLREDLEYVLRPYRVVSASDAGATPGGHPAASRIEGEG